jgi:uncharacterized protein
VSLTPHLRNRPTLLPLVGWLGTGSSATCRWRCGSHCHRESPNSSSNETFEAILRGMLTRRRLLKGGMAVGLVLGGFGRAVGPAQGAVFAASEPAATAGAGAATFEPIAPSTADAVVVPPGYAVDVTLRWGDPILPGARAFDFDGQSSAAQAGQFGYNNDFTAYLPFELGEDDSDHGLLVVNHEFSNPELMFRGYDPSNPTREQVDIELAAHGLSIVEVRRRGGRSLPFGYEQNSPLNRRITATSTLRLEGPAAESDLVKTSADPTGRLVLGTLNNCAGGVTPWGTVLSGEENFDNYFAKTDLLPGGDPRKAVHLRYSVGEGASERKWERYHERFDVTKEPNEPFRFGWVVEVDPYDPTYVPRKRTALGRLKHEGATPRVADDGRVAVYMGDDERFEYVYKFVSDQRYREGKREHNRGLLDAGTLYVARFSADGSGQWLPLVHGQGPLTVDNGFASQADVLVKARIASDLLGATKMDRPEDVETDPVTGLVYLALSHNNRRATINDDGTANPGLDPANPRVANRTGHIIELEEEAADTAFAWRIFLLCGDPADPSTYFAGFDKSQVSPIANPDNLLFDARGNLWIATDGQPGTLKVNNALHCVPTRGEPRGHVQQFLSAPVGAEVCGPELTPDQETLFIAVQHPGADGTVEAPLSTFPDGAQPRPAIVSIFRLEGGRIGR